MEEERDSYHEQRESSHEEGKKEGKIKGPEGWTAHYHKLYGPLKLDINSYEHPIKLSSITETPDMEDLIR